MLQMEMKMDAHGWTCGAKIVYIRLNMYKLNAY